MDVKPREGTRESTALGAPESALALADASDPASEPPPDTLEWRERLDAGTLVAHGRLARGVFLRRAVPLALLAVFSAWFVYAQLAAEQGGTWGNRALLLAVVGSALAWIAVVRARSALDGVSLSLTSEAFTVESSPLTTVLKGVRRVPVADIFAFGAQPDGPGSRLVVLTRDGEALALSCAFRERSHVAFVAARLNRALSDVRARAHYRGAQR
jgi:hypothetical protein